jgi:tetratricopeptide (TPR) repeat protein
MKFKNAKLLNLSFKHNFFIIDFTVVIIVAFFLYFSVVMNGYNIAPKSIVLDAVNLNLTNWSSWGSSVYVSILSLVFKLLNILSFQSQDAFFADVFFSSSFFENVNIVVFALLVSILFSVFIRFINKVLSVNSLENELYLIIFSTLLGLYLFPLQVNDSIVYVLLGFFLINYVSRYKKFQDLNFEYKFLILLLIFIVFTVFVGWIIVFCFSIVLLFLFKNFYSKMLVKIIRLLFFISIATTPFLMKSHSTTKIEEMSAYMKTTVLPTEKFVVVGNSENISNLNSTNKELYLSDNYLSFNLSSRKELSDLFSLAFEKSDKLTFDSLIYKKRMSPYEMVDLSLRQNVKRFVILDLEISKFIEQYKIKDFSPMGAVYKLPNFTISDTIMSPSTHEEKLINASILLNNGDFDSALKNFTDFVKNKNVDTKTLIFIADLFVRQNELNKALNTYSYVIKRNPRDYSLYKKRADLYYKLGLYSSASADYTVVINSKHYDSDIFFNRAICYMKLNRNKRFIANDFKAAEKLGHKLASGYLKMIR